MKKSSLYTRTGDTGMTSFAAGKRVSKSSEYIEVYGTIDELNSNIGYLVSLLSADSDIIPELERVQQILFYVGNSLAAETACFDLAHDTDASVPRNTALEVNAQLIGNGDKDFSTQNKDSIINTKLMREVDRIEALIDKEDSQLPVLKDFIIPGGSSPTAYTHVCRAVCRRLERRLIALSEIQSISPATTIYINRLSDYLFVIARKLNFIDKISEKNISKTCR